MAVAARPGPSDARVPCPLCGGLIHPIAGKCKHCKADLTSYHSARPAANAPLPALQQARAGNGHAGGRPIGDAVPGPTVHAVPAAAMYEASQPVLPPRPTGRSYPTEPGTSSWRSWPVVVIVVAMVAIVVAVVLMVWPASVRRQVDGKHSMSPPPAPERMQTEPDVNAPATPLAPQQPSGDPRGVAPPAKDPWSSGLTAPRPPDPGARADDPDASADPDDGDVDLDALRDPFGSSPGTPGLPHLKLNRSGTVLFAMAEHMCRKILRCGTGDPGSRSLCDTLSHQPPHPLANCPAANRCLEHIDTMSCATQNDDLSRLSLLMTQFTDCAEAIRC